MANAPYRLLAYFSCVAEMQSFRQAAARLDVSVPVVSTAIAELEALAGMTLLHRNSRGATLTPEGQRLFEASSAMVRAADEAMLSLESRKARPSGRLPITLPTELALTWLPPVLRAFEREHPAVDVTVHASDSVQDLQKSDFQLALRAGYSVILSGAADVIDSERLELVAAPSIVPRGRSTLMAVMKQIPYIGFTERKPQDVLIAVRPGGQTVRIPVNVRLRVNNGYVAKELARQGMGAALVMASSAAADLEEGTLAKVADRETFGYVAVRAVFRDRLPSPAARAFIRTAKASAQRTQVS